MSDFAIAAEKNYMGIGYWVTSTVFDMFQNYARSWVLFCGNYNIGTFCLRANCY